MRDACNSKCHGTSRRNVAGCPLPTIGKIVDLMASATPSGLLNGRYAYDW